MGLDVAETIGIAVVFLAGVAGGLCGRSVHLMRHRTDLERQDRQPPGRALVWMVPFLSVVSAALLCWQMLPTRGLWLLPMAPFAVVGAWLSAIDFDVHRLPNRILKPLAGVVVAGTGTAAAVNGTPTNLAVGVGCGVAVLVAFGVLRRFQPHGTGGGDIKVMILAAFMLGGLTGTVIPFCVAMIVAGTVTIIPALVLRRTRNIVFGPGLYIGTITAALLAAGTLP